MNAKHKMNLTNTNAGGWPASEMRRFLNEEIFPSLPIHWRNLIKTVQVRSTEGEMKDTIVTSADKLFCLSAAEVGALSTVPYTDEVDPEAGSIRFPIYTSTADIPRRGFNGEGELNEWCYRSPKSSKADSFIGCWANQNPKYEFSANQDRYVVWACCM